MHATALSNAKLFFDTYVSHLGKVSVVDMGAQDVNGSLRDVCPKNVKYTGVDLVKASGVDVVLTDPYSLPFENDSVDVVTSSSAFEHAELFWVLFLEILRVLKPGGLFYLNAPSNGDYHRYPVDCWRFYPDCGNAFVTWAKRSGLNPALLESYISFQSTTESWNDYVGVFVKDAAHAAKHPKRILHAFKDFYNGVLSGQDGILNPKDAPEDLAKIQTIWKIVDGSIRIR